MNLEGKKFLVFGTGISGISAAELLIKHGFSVVIYDGNEKMTVSEIRQKSDVLKETEIILGVLPERVIHACDIAVLSPGVPTDLPVVETMRRQGIEIWGKLNLPMRLNEAECSLLQVRMGRRPLPHCWELLWNMQFPK